MTVPGNEDEDEVEEMAKQTEEEIVTKSNWPRCAKHKRYMFMHDTGRGANCEMSVLNKDELEVHDRRILLKRLEKAREAQRKDSLEEPVIVAEVFRQHIDFLKEIPNSLPHVQNHHDQNKHRQ